MTNKQSIAKVRYTHDAMIDVIIARPEVSQTELMHMFGYKSPASISVIVNSDAFKEALTKRKGELVDPLLLAKVEDRLTALANKSMERLLERLETQPGMSVKELVSITKVATSGLGLGVSKAPAVQQNLYVIPAPARAQDSTEWAKVVEVETRQIGG